MLLTRTLQNKGRGQIGGAGGAKEAGTVFGGEREEADELECSTG